jgi:tetratricopeptide (TPR) repeat protein
MPESFDRPKSHLGIYRSGLTSPEHRRHITVARQDIVDDTIETLRSNVKKRSKHHYLFIGPRGIGKTHLLSLIEDVVVEDEALASNCVVARFPEESSRTLSFADFLLGLCEILKNQLPDETQWAELHEKLETEDDNSKIVDTIVPAIRKDNRDRERTIIIMLENVNEVFGNQIRDKTDIAALRKFLMDANGCLLIATAPIHFDAITDVGQPFYDFFDTQILQNLTEEETVSLIRQNLEWDGREDLLADLDTLRPRLLALYRMTGGSPRLIVMLYELIAHESITEVQQQFRILLDRITPFYQDRLRDLAPQERALIETMATMRDQPKTPAAISARMRMSAQQTSSILKRLLKSRYLRSHDNPDDGRSRLYTIREGFFDIWLAMNLSRGARKRLPFLLDFFNLFYPTYEAREKKRAELAARITEGDGDAVMALDYLSEVGTAEERAEAKLNAARLHADRGNAEQVSTYLHEAIGFQHDPVGTWIVRHSGQEHYVDYLTEIKELMECWELHRTGELESMVARMVEMGNGLSYRAWSEARIDFLRQHIQLISDPKEQIKQRLRLGDLLRVLARWVEAENQFRLALASAEELKSNAVVSLVSTYLAMLLKDTNRLDEAEPMMRRALKIAEVTFGKDHPRTAGDLNNLAQLLKATNRLDEAEPMIRRALEITEASLGKDHPEVAVRLNNLALLLKDTNRLEEAEPMMRRALEIDEASLGKNHAEVAFDLNNLAQLLQDTNRLDEVEPMMRRALEIIEASFGTAHPNVAACLNNLAQLLYKTNKIDEAEPMMRRAVEIGEASFGKDHPNVAVSLNNLAKLLQDTNRLAEAEPMMRRHVKIFTKSGHETGHEHPHFRTAVDNYKALLQELKLNDKEITERVRSALDSESDE